MKTAKYVSTIFRDSLAKIYAKPTSQRFKLWLKNGILDFLRLLYIRFLLGTSKLIMVVENLNFINAIFDQTPILAKKGLGGGGINMISTVCYLLKWLVIRQPPSPPLPCLYGKKKNRLQSAKSAPPTFFLTTKLVEEGRLHLDSHGINYLNVFPTYAESMCYCIFFSNLRLDNYIFFLL